MEEIRVGCTSHCRSWLEVMAVTVGTKEPGISPRPAHSYGVTHTHTGVDTQNRDTDTCTHTHTPNTQPHPDPARWGGWCGCVCVSQAKKPRHPDTHPSTPLHRDAVVNERISAQLPSPSSSSSFLGEKVARFQRVVVGDSQPGLVTLRLGGVVVGGEETGHSQPANRAPPFLSGTE